MLPRVLPGTRTARRSGPAGAAGRGRGARPCRRRGSRRPPRRRADGDVERCVGQLRRVAARSSSSKPALAVPSPSGASGTTTTTAPPLQRHEAVRGSSRARSRPAVVERSGSAAERPPWGAASTRNTREGRLRSYPKASARLRTTSSTRPRRTAPPSGRRAAASRPRRRCAPAAARAPPAARRTRRPRARRPRALARAGDHPGEDVAVDVGRVPPGGSRRRPSVTIVCACRGFRVGAPADLGRLRASARARRAAGANTSISASRNKAKRAHHRPRPRPPARRGRACRAPIGCARAASYWRRSRRAGARGARSPRAGARAGAAFSSTTEP